MISFVNSVQKTQSGFKKKKKVKEKCFLTPTQRPKSETSYRYSIGGLGIEPATPPTVLDGQIDRILDHVALHHRFSFFVCVCIIYASDPFFLEAHFSFSKVSKPQLAVTPDY